MFARLGLIFAMCVSAQLAWAEGKELECAQLRGAYDTILDQAHSDNYAQVLARAHVDNGIVTSHADGTPVNVAELQALYESYGEKTDGYAVVRLLVGDLLSSLKEKSCDFVEKAIRWAPYLHEPPYEVHAAE